ncbi:LysM peptidoglycan-binding domain-containing protein [Bacteriovorax sp. Seq25_V]|uniref:LysM peptidoglycan-binding domain-containing protein n=1 Tax=Bacteriovorax sp. Seq25_V TaxID=1201288 RepID=UPI00038A4054|nr:LysM peptidoglycan-binding domain-containing protein [Bacteriovorax sp. Seq25_V]EQC47321.1 LysM domain protein [Bacteriovorax sp. Seq25_V]
MIIVYTLLNYSVRAAAPEDGNLKEIFRGQDSIQQEEIQEIKKIAKETATTHGDTYKVEYGDFLHIIALRLYKDAGMWKKIAKWNSIKPPYEIKVGTVLQLKEKPNISIEDGTKLVVEFWRKFLLQQEPDENFENLNAKLDYKKKQQLELLYVKLKLALQANHFQDGYLIMKDIFAISEVDSKLIFYWSLLLEKNKLPLESADIYSQLVKTEKTGPKYLSYILITANKYEAVFKDKAATLTFSKRLRAFNGAIKYYKLAIQNKYKVAKSRLSLSSLYGEMGMFFDAFYELYELQKNAEVLTDEELKQTTEFNIAINKISSGAPTLAMINLQRIKDPTGENPYAKSSQKILESLNRKRYSGHVSLTRALGTNVSALPKELLKESENIDNAQSSQVTTSFNLIGQPLYKIKTNYRLLALYSKQDLKRYSNLNNAYFRAKVEFYKGSFYSIFPKFYLSYSKLFLNIISNESENFRSFSSGYTAGATLETALKYGTLKVTIPFTLSKEDIDSTNDSKTVDLNFLFKLWDINQYLAPSFELELGKENFNKKPENNETRLLLGVFNSMTLLKTSITPTIEYESLKSEIEKERSFKYSVSISKRISIFSKKINIKGSYEHEKRKRSNNNDLIEKKSYEFGLSYFF